MALLPYTPEAARADNLIARLAAQGITYITGGHPLETSPVANAYVTEDRALIIQLIADLVDAPSVRLTDSIITLLLRHPDYVPLAREVLEHLSPTDPRFRSLLARLLAAAALQRIWHFVLRIYLGSQPAIDVEALRHRLGLPSPEQDHGEALLVAAAQWLDPSETIDWVAGWEDAAAQLLSDLRFADAQLE